MSEAFERPSTFFYCSFLLAYLIENDLNNARFLWKRIPADIKKNNAMLGTIWSIGRSMWEKQYAKTYEIVSQTNWDTALVPLINRLVETFRQRTAKLLTTAYTSISASDVSLYLGMNEQDVTKCKSVCLYLSLSLYLSISVSFFPFVHVTPQLVPYY